MDKVQDESGKAEAEGSNPKKKFFSRPADDSLEAYKGWIMGIYFQLTGRTDSSISEEEWVERWKAFWAKANKASNSQP